MRPDRLFFPDRLLFAVALAVAACFAPETAAAAPPLKVGMELAYPPFEMTDAAGKPTGVSVRIAEALGKHLDRDVVIENIARFKRPKQYFRVDALPKNNYGKVLKTELRQRLAARQA